MTAFSWDMVPPEMRQEFRTDDRKGFDRSDFGRQAQRIENDGIRAGLKLHKKRLPHRTSLGQYVAYIVRNASNQIH